MSGGWPPSSSSAIAGTSPRRFLYAFDLELNGEDLRKGPIEARKATLASILRKSPTACAVVFQNACRG
jgi:ATP-dependent DNA ligase